MVAGVLDEVQREEQERVTQPIVGARFRDNEVLHVDGDVLVRELAFDNGVTEDRIRGRDARRHGQRVKVGEVGDEPPHEQRAGHPHASHAWT